MLSAGEREQAWAMVEMFHRLAPGYDRGNRLVSLGGDLRWRRRAAAEALNCRSGRVLDLATGTGDMASALERLGGRVVGIDLSPSMLAIARAKVARGTVLLLGHVLRLPFKANSFDAITIAFALRDIPNLPDTFRECYRVLRSGGRLVCLELSHPCRGVAFFYRLYMERVMPLLGRRVGARGTDYNFLARSAAAFPSARWLAGLMEAGGFGGVGFRRLALGAVAIHWGCKDCA